MKNYWGHFRSLPEINQIDRVMGWSKVDSVKA
jgi:hypothetical protein